MDFILMESMNISKEQTRYGIDRLSRVILYKNQKFKYVQVYLRNSLIFVLKKNLISQLILSFHEE